MLKTKVQLVAIILLTFVCAPYAFAEVRVPSLIGDNMVLQQVASEKLRVFFEVLSEINRVVERPDLFEGIKV